ncbi:unnamed protein product [Lactuca saligna]|uniref:Uncharacterized protein n=1 Tax=Lactuca saligna TaxID=75948 RepID=A0AA35V781_LACSI|nr:unnamed protein product [Lactuca saligna]
MSPYQVLYGKLPPYLIPYAAGSSKVVAVEELLLEQDILMRQLRENLVAACGIGVSGSVLPETFEDEHPVEQPLNVCDVIQVIKEKFRAVYPEHNLEDKVLFEAQENVMPELSPLTNVDVDLSPSARGPGLVRKSDMVVVKPVWQKDCRMAQDEISVPIRLHTDLSAGSNTWLPSHLLQWLLLSPFPLLPLISSCLYLQLLYRYVDNLSRESIPKIFRERKIKRIGIRSDDVADTFEKVVKGCSMVLSSPRLVIPAAIYGLWGISQHFANDFFQLTPAMVGVFAYKAAALVQVYRDNEDLQLIFPGSDEDMFD